MSVIYTNISAKAGLGEILEGSLVLAVASYRFANSCAFSSAGTMTFPLRGRSKSSRFLEYYNSKNQGYFFMWSYIPPSSLPNRSIGWMGSECKFYTIDINSPGTLIGFVISAITKWAKRASVVRVSIVSLLSGLTKSNIMGK